MTSGLHVAAGCITPSEAVLEGDTEDVDSLVPQRLAYLLQGLGPRPVVPALPRDRDDLAVLDDDLARTTRWPRWASYRDRLLLLCRLGQMDLGVLIAGVDG